MNVHTLRTGKTVKNVFTGRISSPIHQLGNTSSFSGGGVKEGLATSILLEGEGHGRIATSGSTSASLEYVSSPVCDVAQLRQSVGTHIDWNSSSISFLGHILW